MAKYLLAALLFTGALISVGTYYVFSFKHIPSVPLDENGQKIKLGGIPWPFENCGTEFDPLQITSIVFAGQPERGAPPNDAVISGSIMKHEDYSIVNVIVKLNNVQVFNNNLPCTGTYDPGDMFIFKYAFQVPGIAPGGPYSVYFRFMNKQSQATSCTKVDMDL